MCREYVMKSKSMNQIQHWSWARHSANNSVDHRFADLVVGTPSIDGGPDEVGDVIDVQARTPAHAGNSVAKDSASCLKKKKKI